MGKSISLLSLFLLFVGLSVAQTTLFVGSWTDTDQYGYGGVLYICQDPNQLTISGMYSETGVMYGNLDYTFNQITGWWYEGGLGDCLTGTFDLVLDVDKDSFSGYWQCAEDPDTDYEWVSTRINGTTPTIQQCAMRSQDFDGYMGTWVAEDLLSWICPDGSSMTYALSYTPGGYEEGYYDATNQVLGGSYTSVMEGSTGTSLFFTLYDGTIGNVWWEGYDVVFSRATYIHGYDIYDYANETTSDECTANADAFTLTWEGQWTDSIYGESLYICMDSGMVSGIYTQAGLIFGNVTNNGTMIEGEWFEGGLEGSCRQGRFEFEMSMDGNSFSGCWGCAGDSCSNTWNGNRIDRDVPSNMQCGRLMPTYEVYDMSGFWTIPDDNTTSLDICVGSDSYEKSYEYVDNYYGVTDGYEVGYVALEGRVAGGEWYEPVYQGISLNYLGWNGEFYELWWDGFDAPSSADYYVSGTHSYDAYVFAGETTTAACERNSYLFPTEPYYPSYSSSASTFTAGISMMAVLTGAIIL